MCRLIILIMMFIFSALIFSNIDWSLILKDYATIIGTFIIAIGWFVNGWLNRWNEISKERRALTLEFQNNVIDLWFFIAHTNPDNTNRNNIINKLNEILPKVYIYGFEDDIKNFQEMIDFYIKSNRNNHIEFHIFQYYDIQFRKSLDYFKDGVVEKFRSELNLGKYYTNFSKEKYKF